MMARRWLALPLLLAPLVFAGCAGDGTGTEAAGQVTVRMGVARPASAQTGDGLAAVGGPLAVAGANGTLSITGIQVVIAKFQLRGPNDVPCAGASGAVNDECEFQAGPFFVDVPLDGNRLNVTTGAVPAGTYTHVRFRVKNLDDDDDDDGSDDDNVTPAQVAALFEQIRAQIPDWPRKASMLVTGTFTPTGGAPRAFRAFARAEVRLTLPINPPLSVGEGSTSSAVTVVLDPASFFKTGTNVIDLSQFSSGRLGEFKVEAERGFRGEGKSGPG
jgi:hypothetical protein